MQLIVLATYTCTIIINRYYVDIYLCDQKFNTSRISYSYKDKACRG